VTINSLLSLCIDKREVNKWKPAIRIHSRSSSHFKCAVTSFHCILPRSIIPNLLHALFVVFKLPIPLSPIPAINPMLKSFNPSPKSDQPVPSCTSPSRDRRSTLSQPPPTIQRPTKIIHRRHTPQRSVNPNPRFLPINNALPATTDNPMTDQDHSS
jgi:hypothetical protein